MPQIMEDIVERSYAYMYNKLNSRDTDYYFWQTTVRPLILATLNFGV